MIINKKSIGSLTIILLFISILISGCDKKNNKEANTQNDSNTTTQNEIKKEKETSKDSTTTETTENDYEFSEKEINDAINEVVNTLSTREIDKIFVTNLHFDKEKYDKEVGYYMKYTDNKYTAENIMVLVGDAEFEATSDIKVNYQFTVYRNSPKEQWIVDEIYMGY